MTPDQESLDEMLRDEISSTARPEYANYMAYKSVSSGSTPPAFQPVSITSVGASPPAFANFKVIPNPWAVETKDLSREKETGFWRRVWEDLTDLNPWPYSPIEYYELEIPAVMLDRPNSRIICHPSLEGDIKKAIGIIVEAKI